MELASHGNQKDLSFDEGPFIKGSLWLYYSECIPLFRFLTQGIL